MRVKQGTSSRLNQIKKKSGEITWSETEVKGTWKKYFRDLYGNDNGEKHLNTISAQEKIKILLKNCKVRGIDGIFGEIIR